ncbi:hypothetical protein CLAFUW4_10870 [Fulvia fulva]|nr:hypothetical protein CLAFUR4_10875 [Fulvia fulva]KAK4620593.1 hypothetical protein CLAFUR0_10882 [Fulvia fulva]WPV17258.1 hypothetical protein CLAFUW4_10870 [Fulvia fulva]WPV32244.1 hypothetical protein CLAFUW7_10868 [Fulvia fulva]
MAAEISLSDSPPQSGHKRAASSIRSIGSGKPTTSSKFSTASDKSYYCDLLGLRTKEKDRSSDASASPSSSRLSTTGSIASGKTGSSTSSDVSTLTNSSSKSSISMTEHDLFGTKLPPTEEELAPSAPDAVELESGKFKVPEGVEKQFFKDLTVLEDGEMVGKYGLVEVGEEDEAGEEGEGESRKRRVLGKVRRVLEGSRHGVKEMSPANSIGSQVRMRLINVDSLEIHDFGDSPPPYAILSHRWEGAEITYADYVRWQRHTTTSEHAFVSRKDDPGFDSMALCHGVQEIRAFCEFIKAIERYHVEDPSLPYRELRVLRSKIRRTV